MKQVEITLRVKKDLNENLKILEEKSFKKIRESNICDIYMTQYFNELKANNIEYVLSKCLLLRHLNENGSIFKKVTYKNKIFENGNLISEEKINLDCNDLEKAEKLFSVLEFKELIKVKYKVIVIAKNDLEFAFQVVDGLGLLVEYENKNDFDTVSNEEIIKIKHKMKEEIESYGIDVENTTDVKKAKELIIKKFNVRCID